MRILVIDNVNFTDYPTGGIMNFYRNMLPAFGNDLLLAGITTDGTGEVGEWGKREMNGCQFDFYTMAHITPASKRPLIPERITNCIHIKKHIKRILRRNDFDIVLTQAPEVVHFIPERDLKRTCFIMPGVSNPLLIARYPLAKYFAKYYDRFFLMPKAAKVKWLLAAADKSACEGFSDRSHGLISASRIIQFPTRYSDKYFFPDDQGVCRKSIGYSDDTIVITTVGRLGWYKGWKLLIDSYVLFANTHPNSVLLFVGDGEDEDRMNNYIKDIRFEDRICLLGKRPPKEIGGILNASNVFVMGSFTEGWSTTLLEACACGIPCVVTNFSSAKELVQNGVNGYVVENRDASVFAKRIEMALMMKRESIIRFNERIECFAESRLKDDLLSKLL